MSTGWNEVSLRLSKPVPNSICGTEHDPKLPMSVAVLVAAAAVVTALAAAEVVAALVAEAAATL